MLDETKHPEKNVLICQLELMLQISNIINLLWLLSVTLTDGIVNVNGEKLISQFH